MYMCIKEEVYALFEFDHNSYCVHLYLANIFHLALIYTSTHIGLQLVAELHDEMHINIST